MRRRPFRSMRLAVLRAIERDQFLAAVTGHGDANDEAAQVVGRLLSIR